MHRGSVHSRLPPLTGGAALILCLLFFFACEEESYHPPETVGAPDTSGETTAEVRPPSTEDARAPAETAAETGSGSRIVDPPRRDAGRHDTTLPGDTPAGSDARDTLDDDNATPDSGNTGEPGCPDYTLAPVLLVHGYGAGAEVTWWHIRERLIEDCWPPEFVYAPEFIDVTGCNPAHGNEIAAWVRELKERTGRDKVDIVAHSMGGLDARYYIKYLCGYRHVRNFVSIAGAHHGSWMGCLARHTCGGEQLCRGLGADDWRDNPFLADLNDCDETPGEEILYMSIWSDGDEIVLPPESSILDGARNVQLEHPIGHAGIFLEDEPYEWIKIGLNGGGENNNLVPGAEPCYKICPPGL